MYKSFFMNIGTMHHTPEYELFASYAYYGIVGLFSIVLFVLAVFHVALPAAGYGLVWDTESGSTYVLQKSAYTPAYTLGDTLVAVDENGAFVSGMMEGVTRQSGYSMYRITNAQGYSAMVAGRNVFGVVLFSVPVVGVFLGILANPFGSAFLLWGPLAMVVMYVFLRRYTTEIVEVPEEKEQETSAPIANSGVTRIHNTKKVSVAAPRPGMFLKGEV